MISEVYPLANVMRYESRKATQGEGILDSFYIGSATNYERNVIERYAMRIAEDCKYDNLISSNHARCKERKCTLEQLR